VERASQALKSAAEAPPSAALSLSEPLFSRARARFQMAEEGKESLLNCESALTDLREAIKLTPNNLYLHKFITKVKTFLNEEERKKNLDASNRIKDASDLVNDASNEEENQALESIKVESSVEVSSTENDYLGRGEAEGKEQAGQEESVKDKGLSSLKVTQESSFLVQKCC